MRHGLGVGQPQEMGDGEWRENVAGSGKYKAARSKGAAGAVSGGVREESVPTPARLRTGAGTVYHQ